MSNFDRKLEEERAMMQREYAGNEPDPSEPLRLAEDLLNATQSIMTQKMPMQFDSPYDAAKASILSYMVDAPKRVLQLRVQLSSAETKMEQIASSIRLPYDYSLEQKINAMKTEIQATQELLTGYMELLKNIHEWEKQHAK